MKNNSLQLLRSLLWLICATHVAIGGGLNLLPDAAPFLAKLYGAEVQWTPEFSYILKPLGAFMLAIGLVTAAAAVDPLKHGAVVYSLAALFVMRALQRLLFADEIAQTFHIASGRNLANMAFFLVLAAILVGLHRSASKGTRQAMPAGVAHA
jgi:hypothetical protein